MDWLQLGVAGGALTAMLAVARIFKRIIDRVVASQEETTDKVLTFFGNHMSESVRQQAETTQTLRALAEAVERLRVELHDQRSVH